MSRLPLQMPQESQELDGLNVNLDKLVYHNGGVSVPPDTPHVFVYFLTIENRSDRWVKLLGRKWVITQANGETLIVEGDKIVGEEPEIAPGEKFSYNSFHLGDQDATATGSFHGIDANENRIRTRIPPFEMTIPAEYR